MIFLLVIDETEVFFLHGNRNTAGLFDAFPLILSPSHPGERDGGGNALQEARRHPFHYLRGKVSSFPSKRKS